MTQSLRWRLMVAAACSIVAALALSGFVLMLLFERHVVRRVEHELQSYTKQLAASITIDGQSRPELATELSDPRFEQPYSGLYWQVAEGGKVVLRSRSLWDQSLRISGSAQGKSTGYRREESGPAGESLIVFQRDIFMAAGQSERALTLTAALDWSEVASARTDFLQDLAIALSLLAVFLLGASWLQIRVGLGPLSTIRSRINDVRRGSQRRLEGAFPNEVSPLVGELNALLDAQDESVTRARYGAADLAHGLKTPLTILQAECRALRSCGMPQAAAEIEEQVEHMRRRVERHLAIARLRKTSGSISVRTSVAPVLDRLLETLKRMPRGDTISWQPNVPPELQIAMDKDDLTEVLGNILDNARKWSRSTVRIAGRISEETLAVSIQDDGPGVDDGELSRLIERGHRDTSSKGSGLGLAIAQEIMEAYGGRLFVDKGDLGGLMATLELPNR